MNRSDTWSNVASNINQNQVQNIIKIKYGQIVFNKYGVALIIKH